MEEPAGVAAPLRAHYSCSGSYKDYTRDTKLKPELGIIEGFYGKPWDWEYRKESVSFLAPYGYRFYMYAPKADVFLGGGGRRRIRNPSQRRWNHSRHTAAKSASVSELGSAHTSCSTVSTTESRARLSRKLEFFDSIGAEDVAILFDDMRGDVPDLAKRQIEIVHCVADERRPSRVITCPSYYSDDPILDRVFGARPDKYLEELGKISSRTSRFLDRRRSNLTTVFAGTSRAGDA